MIVYIIKHDIILIYQEGFFMLYTIIYFTITIAAPWKQIFKNESHRNKSN